MSDLVSKVKLSVRRKPISTGVVGDDPTEYKFVIGSSLTSTGVINSGLNREESVRYLPEIIGISADSNDWNLRVKEYWSNINEKVPADGTTADEFQGKVLEFTVQFENEQDYKAFENAGTFEEKGLLAEKGRVIEGVPSYVLFKYCLKYSRVANIPADMNKSKKIFFYL